MKSNPNETFTESHLYFYNFYYFSFRLIQKCFSQLLKSINNHKSTNIHKFLGKNDTWTSILLLVKNWYTCQKVNKFMALLLGICLLVLVFCVLFTILGFQSSINSICFLFLYIQCG